jgi:hypothetical protein
MLNQYFVLQLRTGARILLHDSAKDIAASRSIRGVYIYDVSHASSLYFFSFLSLICLSRGNRQSQSSLWKKSSPMAGVIWNLLIIQDQGLITATVPCRQQDTKNNLFSCTFFVYGEHAVNDSTF